MIEKISGDQNFRELGGYVMKDGRTIKKGLLYRAAALGYYSPEELEIVQKLGIRTVLDLRSEYERSRNPDPLLEGSEYIHISAFIDKYGNELDLSPQGIAQATGGTGFSGDADAFLKYMYGALLFDSSAYQMLFDIVLEERVPVLFHCTAGKDRTGVGAVLLLLALGADEDLIREDYMLTNVYREHAIEAFIASQRELLQQYPEMETSMRAFEGVSPKAMDIVLNGILKRYDSYEEYLAREYGIDEKKRALLQEMYLE